MPRSVSDQRSVRNGQQLDDRSTADLDIEGSEPGECSGCVDIAEPAEPVGFERECDTWDERPPRRDLLRRLVGAVEVREHLLATASDFAQFGRPDPLFIRGYGILDAAAALAGNGLNDLNADLHASAEYRRAMIPVFTRRALQAARARV